MIKQFLTYREFLNEGLNSSRKAFLNTGKIGPEEFERLTLLDVTPTKKYLDSICRFYLEGHSEEEIKIYIDRFNTLGSNLPKKDINLYSFEELKSSLDSYNSKNQKDKLTTKDIEVVYEDERFFIVRPDTFEQSAKYGRGTKWCITGYDGGRQYWDNYRNLNYTFYFILDKSLPSTNPLYKVAIAVDEYGEIEKGKNTTVNSLNKEIDGEEYILKNMLPREIFSSMLNRFGILKKFGIDLELLNGDVYEGDYENFPYGIVEFKGFKEELDLDINEVRGDFSIHLAKKLISVSNFPKNIIGDLRFTNCTSLVSMSNLPEYIGGDLHITNCDSLNSVSNFPSVVEGSIETKNCPFFEGMNEEQIRQKYNISR